MVACILAGLLCRAFSPAAASADGGGDVDNGFVGVRVDVDNVETHANDSFLPNYVSVERTVKVGYYVEAGTSKAGLSIQGQRMTGRLSRYSLTMRDDLYRRLVREKRPLPHPYDPRTLPAGASVVVEQGRFNESGFSASYAGIVAETSGGSSKGLAIGLDKLSDGRVRAVSGPFEAVYHETFLGLGIDANVLEARLGLTNSIEIREYTLRTATFDLDSRQGLAAFHRFFLTGRTKAVYGHEGVSDVGLIKKERWVKEAGWQAGGKVLGAGGYLGSSDRYFEADVVKAIYNDRVDIQKRVPYKERRLVSRAVTRRGSSPGRPEVRLILPKIQPELAELFSRLAAKTDYLPRAFREAPQSARYSAFDLQFSFLPDDVSVLQRKARACLESEQCRCRVGPRAPVLKEIAEAPARPARLMPIPDPRLYPLMPLYPIDLYQLFYCLATRGSYRPADVKPFPVTLTLVGRR